MKAAALLEMELVEALGDADGRGRSLPGLRSCWGLKDKELSAEVGKGRGGRGRAWGCLRAEAPWAAGGAEEAKAKKEQAQGPLFLSECCVKPLDGFKQGRLTFQKDHCGCCAEVTVRCEPRGWVTR